MACPQATDGGDGFQVWRLTANILNKQSRTADKESASSLGVGRGVTTPCLNLKSLLRNVTKGLGPGRIIRINELK
jgi:hypothetical protein